MNHLKFARELMEIIYDTTSVLDGDINSETMIATGTLAQAHALIAIAEQLQELRSDLLPLLSIECNAGDITAYDLVDKLAEILKSREEE